MTKGLTKVCTALLYDGSEVLSTNIGAKFDFAVPGFKKKTRSTRITPDDATLRRYGANSRVPVTIALRLYFSKRKELANLLNPPLKDLIAKFVEYRRSISSEAGTPFAYMKEKVWRILFHIFFQETHDSGANTIPFCKIIAVCICTYRRNNPGTMSHPKIAPPESVRSKLSGISYMLTCAVSLRKYKYTKGNYKPSEYKEIKQIMEPRTPAAFGILVDLRSKVLECCGKLSGQDFKPCDQLAHGLCGQTGLFI